MQRSLERILDLFNYVCREHCVLIVVTPRSAYTYFLDSTRKEKKDYKGIKKVLDEALYEYTTMEGVIRDGHKWFDKFKMIRFTHKSDFCFLQQPENSDADAYYVIHQMEEYLREGEQLKKQSDVMAWGKKMEETLLGDRKDEFRRLQVKFATIINKDVVDHAGVFNGGSPSDPKEIQNRLKQQVLDADYPVSISDPTIKFINDPYYDVIG